MLDQSKGRAAALQPKQEAFGREAGGEAGEGVVGAYYTVAGDEDGYAVRSYGLGYGADAAEIVHAQGDFLVSPCLSVRYLEQCLPYRHLEGRSDGMQRNVEGCAAACEILVKFRFSALQNRGGFFPEFRTEEPFKPSHIALCAGLRFPVAEAKLVPDGGKHKITTRGKVVLDVYVHHNSSFA